MKILEAIYALFFFEPYTRFSRWFEISYGIIAWGCLIIIVYSFIKIL